MSPPLSACHVASSRATLDREDHPLLAAVTDVDSPVDPDACERLIEITGPPRRSVLLRCAAAMRGALSAAATH